MRIATGIETGRRMSKSFEFVNEANRDDEFLFFAATERKVRKGFKDEGTGARTQASDGLAPLVPLRSSLIYKASGERTLATTTGSESSLSLLYKTPADTQDVAKSVQTISNWVADAAVREKEEVDISAAGVNDFGESELEASDALEPSACFIASEKKVSSRPVHCLAYSPDGETVFISPPVKQETILSEEAAEKAEFSSSLAGVKKDRAALPGTASGVWAEGSLLYRSPQEIFATKGQMAAEAKIIAFDTEAAAASTLLAAVAEESAMLPEAALETWTAGSLPYRGPEKISEAKSQTAEAEKAADTVAEALVITDEPDLLQEGLTGEKREDLSLAESVGSLVAAATVSEEERLEQEPQALLASLEERLLAAQAAQGALVEEDRQILQALQRKRFLQEKASLKAAVVSAAIAAPVEDILLVQKSDRRVLSKVPDPDGVRTNFDRRQVSDETKDASFVSLIEREEKGRRYLVNYDVELQYVTGGRKKTCSVKGVDISTSGMLLSLTAEEKPLAQGAQIAQELLQASKITLDFAISPGSMPEGYEMKVRVGAYFIRSHVDAQGTIQCGLQFAENLAQYAARKKNWQMMSVASIFLFFICLGILLIRAESVLYFNFNKVLYSYSLVAATFLLSRYFFASFYRSVPIDKDFTPGVSIIIPCFNEEEWIQKTIVNCVNQDYPTNKLEVIVVDDCSTDKSLEKIDEIVAVLKEKEKRYHLESRLHVIRQEQNAGKREAMGKGTLLAKHELVVFVDSDSFLDPFAIRNLVQPFQDEKMGGVSGRTDVANTYTNALTKMQAVRYYIAFRIMKAAEGYFDAVTCLSGPLSCYRKDLVLKNLDAWLNQKFLGERATFGDDRSMTNFILRENRTTYQDTAICTTIVPNKTSIFLKQQMRWKRSWLRESLVASRFMWKKEPFMALSFYMGVLVPLVSPVIVLYNIIYVPLIHRVAPVTFFIGIFLMALLMSMAQLLLRRSSTWIYGLWFCVYYEAVLLWQMPVAWVTFWKTTWGTRMTAADVKAVFKKKNGKTMRV